jgi:hypothetical protein
MEKTPIPSLSEREAVEEEEILHAFALNYCTLINIDLLVELESSSPLLKVVELSRKSGEICL